MGMYASSKFYESGFNLFKTIEPAKVICITSMQNTNMSSAIAGALAWATQCASSDYVISSNTSGYIVTVSSNAELINATTLESTGKATHICIGSTVNLHYITTCTSKALGSGDTVNKMAA